MPLEFTDERLLAVEMARLQKAYPDWYAKYPGSRATYAVPDRVVTGRSLDKLFTPRELEAEREFTAGCTRLNAIGINIHQPINYPLFTTTQLFIDESLADKLGWSKADRLAAEEVSIKAQTSHDRILGVAGRLMTEPVFLQEVEKLRSEWEVLAVEELRSG